MTKTILRVGALALLACGALPLVAGQTEESAARDVTLRFRLCEGPSGRPFLGDEALKRWHECRTAVVDVPVRMMSGAESSDGRTDDAGEAELGPLPVPAGSRVRVGVACTTHVCLTWNIAADELEPGVNYVLYEAPRRER